jgi:hypothetical protein
MGTDLRGRDRGVEGTAHLPMSRSCDKLSLPKTPSECNPSCSKTHAAVSGQLPRVVGGRVGLLVARWRVVSGRGSCGSERAIRPLAIGRKKWLLAASKRGGDATGILLSLIQTCRAMDIEPFAYLEDVLRRINGPPANRLDELFPGNWAEAESHYG